MNARIARTAAIATGLAAVLAATTAIANHADAATAQAVKSCRATWYGAPGEIPEGWPTASGQPFHRLALKAASNELKFGTRVKVTYGSRSVIVTINDRGGFRRPVCLDLTYGAFRKIANPNLGNIAVKYQVL
jgi:rare lipoprotein A (peptidoglycan hydrolase)